MYRRLLAGASLAVGVAYARGRVVKAQVSAYARYWEESNVAVISRLLHAKDKGEELPLVMVALGDSCAQGIGAASPDLGYVPRVAAAVADMTGREVALINLSISGAVFPTVASHQIPGLAGIISNGITPDIVTMDVGSNDVRSPASLESIGSYATSMAASLPPGSFVATVPTFGPGSFGKRAEDISVIIRNAFAEHNVVELEAMTKEIAFFRNYLALHSPDFFHPNEDYYEMWAQVWADAIASTLNAPTLDVGDAGPYMPWIEPAGPLL